MTSKISLNIDTSNIVEKALRKPIGVDLNKSISDGVTTPSVQILTLRNIPENDDIKDTPNPDDLSYGQLSINYNSGKERIFFKNNDGLLAIFDTSKNILLQIDDKNQNLQDQIDIINGDSTVNGSFAHADKVLENNLQTTINSKIVSVTGQEGIITNTDTDKNVVVKGYVNPNDKILNVNNNGFAATILATYDWVSGTIKLIGKDPNVPISQFKIQTGEKMIKAELYIGVGNETPTPLINGDLYIKYSFGTDGVEHEYVYCHLTPILPIITGENTDSMSIIVNQSDKFHHQIRGNVKISTFVSSNNEFNSLKIKNDGLFVSNIYDAGTYTSTNRTNGYKLQNLRSSVAGEVPNTSVLEEGELAVNMADGQEKIYFKNSSGDSLAVFDTTKSILTIVDNTIANELLKLTDPNKVGSLQYQVNSEIDRAKAAEKANTDKINVINGDDMTNGSFMYADKMLKTEIMEIIDSITGSSAMVVIYGGNTSTTEVHYDIDTKTVTADVKISSDPNNELQVKADGLCVDFSGYKVKISPDADNKIENRANGLYANIKELNAGEFY